MMDHPNGMGSAQGMPEPLTAEQQENIHMLSAGVQLTILAVLIAAFVYGYYERQRRRRIAAENGGFPARTGTMRTGLFECIGTPSVCFPASFFTPILAAFNRAEVDGRDCHACDALWAMKTPITQYHTRQSIRAKYDLEEAPCTDCLQVVCCTPCAVGQDTIELERRTAIPAPAARPAAPPAYAQTVVVETSVPMAPVTHGEYEKVPAQCQV